MMFALPSRSSVFLSLLILIIAAPSGRADSPSYYLGALIDQVISSSDFHDSMVQYFNPPSHLEPVFREHLEKLVEIDGLPRALADEALALFGHFGEVSPERISEFWRVYVFAWAERQSQLGLTRLPVELQREAWSLVISSVQDAPSSDCTAMFSSEMDISGTLDTARNILFRMGEVDLARHLYISRRALASELIGKPSQVVLNSAQLVVARQAFQMKVVQSSDPDIRLFLDHGLDSLSGEQMCAGVLAMMRELLSIPGDAGDWTIIWFTQGSLG